MFNNGVLDVVIGLIFIYLLYSLLATTIQETISTLLHRRANTLSDGIKSMLSNRKEDNGIVVNLILYLIVGMYVDLWKWMNKLFAGKKEDTLHREFYNHPIIKNYGENLFFKKPSYLTAENFSSILIETLKNLDAQNAEATATFALIRSIVDSNKPKSDSDSKTLMNDRDLNEPGNGSSSNKPKIDSETWKIINYHLNEAAGDLNVFKYRIGKWYNDTMDRVSGWYKRNTQFYLLFVGLYMAISLNIDSIEITNYLSDNKTAREQLARMGEAAAGNQQLKGVSDTIAKEALDSIKAGIGKVNTIVGLGWGDYGSSDTAYRNYRLADSLYKNYYFALDTTKIYKAYKMNSIKANSSFKKDSLRADFIYRNYDALNDTIHKRSSKYIMDSLIQSRDEIISQTQFALLYGNKDFEDGLRFKYVLYRTKNWKKIFGFLITALAISLGAPFWFDLLNKFVSLRTAVKTVNSSGSTTRNNASDNDESDG